MFFKPWQVKALNYLKSIHPAGANSKKVYDAVNESTRISRASIINFLYTAVDENLLTYIEVTGKGGHHRIFKHAHTENGEATHIAKQVINHLLKEFPEETRAVIEKMSR